MKTQFSSKSGNTQQSDDDTTTQIQIAVNWAWITAAVIAGLVVWYITSR